MFRNVKSRVKADSQVQSHGELKGLGSSASLVLASNSQNEPCMCVKFRVLNLVNFCLH